MMGSQKRDLDLGNYPSCVNLKLPQLSRFGSLKRRKKSAYAATDSATRCRVLEAVGGRGGGQSGTLPTVRASVRVHSSLKT